MNTNIILYDRPAEAWKESIPLGNGHMGAMVWGGVTEDLINLNEESIWDKPFDDYCNPKAAGSLSELRRLLFTGKLAEAEALAKEAFISVPGKFGAYLPFGDLVIKESDTVFAHSDLRLKACGYTDYRRVLDLGTGVLHVSYKKRDVMFHREYFISHPDQVLVIRCYHDSDLPVDYQVQIRKGYDSCAICSASDPAMIYYEDQLCNNGIRYCGAVLGWAGSGRAENNLYPWQKGYTDACLGFYAVNDFVIYAAISTDYHGNDPCACYERVRAAAQKGYEQILADHIADYQTLYQRFEIHLTDPGVNSETTMSWLDRVKSGQIDPAFTELYMNYSRYLLISASRAGGLPSNLQGVWNERQHPGCESDYHLNINYQINYWTAQAWGLDECDEPLAGWLEELVPYGEDAARRTYGTRGWVVHHCSDIFGYAWPNFDPVGLWPVGGAWICRHLYERWQYQRNDAMMRNRFWPVIAGSVRFILDFLVEAPQDTACPGALVTCPSISPENTYIMPDGGSGMLTYASTMDIQIIQDLFAIAEEMLNAIRRTEPGFEAALSDEMAQALKRMPPVVVSPSHGGIQEWIEDYKEQDQGHRHVSQLYGVYPGCSISDTGTPALAQAARRTIERKYEAGYDGQGWSLAWIGNLWARLGEGEKAFASVAEAYQRHLLPNLMINAHGMPQVSDMFGLPAAILEMLVQSHEGKIILLPACPEAISDGSVHGLRVRGGHSVDMTWTGGMLQKAVIHHLPGSVSMPVEMACGGSYDIFEDEDETRISIAGESE